MVLDAARRGPTAGNTWSIDLVVLDTPAAVSGYWDVTLSAPDARRVFPWPGLLLAPVLVVVCTDPDAYVQRYAQPDKARSALGVSRDDWPVPYWWVDAGAAVMAMLLAATAAGLGSLLFGVFEHEADVATHLAIPAGRHIVGTVALGYRAEAQTRSSASLVRRRPELSRVVHRGRW